MFAADMFKVATLCIMFLPMTAHMSGRPVCSVTDEFVTKSDHRILDMKGDDQSDHWILDMKGDVLKADGRQSMC